MTSFISELYVMWLSASLLTSLFRLGPSQSAYIFMEEGSSQELRLCQKK